MGTVRICKGRHGIITVRHPFAMVKGITRRSSKSLKQIADTINNKKTFVRSIIDTRIFATCFSTEVKEQCTFGAVLGKRSIASLFGHTLILIPHRIVGTRHYRRTIIRQAGTQKSRPRHGKGIVFADTAMVSSIKKLLRLAEFTIRKRHLPG